MANYHKDQQVSTRTSPWSTSRGGAEAKARIVAHQFGMRPLAISWPPGGAAPRSNPAPGRERLIARMLAATARTAPRGHSGAAVERLFLSAAILFVLKLFFADSGERAVVQATMMGGVAILVSSLLLPRQPRITAVSAP